MPRFAWNESLSVGYEPIDEQHKRLIALINQLHDAMIDDKGQEVLGEILDGLIAYTRSHFAMEERLMHAHDYPLSDGHKRMHSDLVRKAVEFRGQFVAGQPVLTEDVMKFLQEWWTKHVQGSDKTLGSFLAATATAGAS